MVSLRGSAFVVGGLGLALFVGGILWALVVPADPACADAPAGKLCKAAYGSLLDSVMVVIGFGAACEAAAVVLLFLHLSKKGPAPLARTAAPRSVAPAGPAPGSAPPAPRNRFLEPPVPPQNGNGPARKL